MLNGNCPKSITLADFIDECEIRQWVMRHREIVRIQQYCDIFRAMQKDIRIVQIGQENGFAAKLLSDEGLSVKLLFMGEVPEEVSHAYSASKKLFLEGRCNLEHERSYRRCPIVFPTDNLDIMNYFAYAKPFNVKGDYTWMIVHLRRSIEHETPPGHVLVDTWKTYRVNDLCSLDDPKPQSDIAIFVRHDLDNRFRKELDAVKRSKQDVTPYNWEKEMPPIKI